MTEVFDIEGLRLTVTRPGQEQAVVVATCGVELARWDAETDAATFDWAAIGNEVAVSGDALPLARMLLVARAMGRSEGRSEGPLPTADENPPALPENLPPSAVQPPPPPDAPDDPPDPDLARVLDAPPGGG